MRIGPVLSALSLLIASNAFCQSSSSPVDIGLQAYHDYHGSDFDHVNLDNGNLTVSFPIVSYPQRGNALKIDFGITYNGTGRTYQQVVCVQGKCEYAWLPSSHSYTGMALTPISYSASPALYDLQQASSAETKWTLPGTNPQAYFLQTVWYTADGGAHASAQTSNDQISLDGSGFQVGFVETSGPTPTDTCTWDCSLPGIIPSPFLVGTHDGITYMGSSTGNATARMDADGNYITQSSTAGITDTVGRSIPIPTVNSSPTPAETASCTGPLTISEIATWTPPGFFQQFTFCYAQVPLTMAIQETNGTTPVNHSTELMLQSIVLPNGQAWTFEYNENLTNCPPSNLTTNIGDLTHITLPTGGTIDYTYTCLAPFKSTFPTQTTAVTSRTVNANDGTGPHTWNYSYSISSSGSVTTVTDPLGNDSTHSLNSSALPTPNRVENYYAGSHTSGTLLRTIATAYQSQYTMGNGYPMYPTTVTTTLENGQSTQTAYQYCCNYSFLNYATGGQPIFPQAASYGKVTDTKVYDYSGSLLKETARSYLFQSNSNYLNPGFFDLVSQTTIYNGSGTETAQTTYGYDETSRVTSGIVGMAGAKITSPIYGVFGHQTSATLWLNTGPSNPKSTTSYYDTGEAYQSADPLGHTASTYFCTGSSPTTLPCSASTYLGALPTVVSNALSQQTTFSYRTDTGQKLTVTDPNSQTTTDTYSDPLNRLTSVQYPDGGLTSIQYNDTGSIGVTVTEKITSSLNKQIQAIVDGLGREYETILSLSPKSIYTYKTYDALGRTYQVWNPTSCSPPTSNCGESTWGYTTYGYDALNRTTSQIDSDLSSTQTWAYSGNTVTWTNEIGNHWARTSDALGRLTKVMEPDGSTNIGSTPTHETDYQFDALNNLLRVDQWGGPSGSSGDRVRTLAYDSLSRLTNACNLESIAPGSTCGSSGPWSDVYSYDNDGNVLSKTDARGLTIQYSYDQLNRLQVETNPSGTANGCFWYDNASVSSPPSGCPALPSGLAAGANLAGRTAFEWTSDSKTGTGFGYDSMGRINSKSECTPSTCGRATYGQAFQYDYSGNPTTYANGVGVTITSSYDAADRLSGVSSSLIDSNHPGTLWTANAYGPIGLTQATLGNGVVEKTAYDTRQRVTTDSFTNPSSQTIYSYSLGYFVNSSVQSVTDSANGNWTYQMDNLNRLYSASASGGPLSGIALQWGIDAWGNRNTQTVTAGSGPQPSFSSTTNNQITGYCYDNAGDLLDQGACVNGTQQYTYDGVGRLISPDHGNTFYIYDAEGNRVAKQVSGASTYEFLYDRSGHPITELGSGGGWNRGEVYAGNRHIATYASGTTYFTHTDWLVNIRANSTMTASVQNTCGNLPFGDDFTCTNPITDIEFTDKERDSESSNDYFGARYYGSSMGRFMSPDPHNPILIRQGSIAGGLPEEAANSVFLGFLENPQNWNGYTYVRNNPLGFTDPTGGFPAASDGHHLLVERGSISNPLARDFANSIKTGGPNPPSNVWSNASGHPEYNNAVNELEQELEQTQGDSNGWSLSQWKDFATKVLNSDEPAIKNFLDQIEAEAPGSRAKLAALIAAYQPTKAVIARTYAWAAGAAVGIVFSDILSEFIVCATCNHEHVTHKIFYGPPPPA